MLSVRPVGNAEVHLNKQLEDAFHKAMIGVYERAKAECRYNATRFWQLLAEQGGLQAAKTLLRAEGLSDGLSRLWQEGRWRLPGVDSRNWGTS
jgi:hypothetical protein